MAPGAVDQQKKELCKQAYLLISKYLAASGKEGQESFEFRKTLRRRDALDIDMATNKEVVNEVNRFKEMGGAASLTGGGGAAAGYGGGGGGGGGSKPPAAARSRGGGGGSLPGTASKSKSGKATSKGGRADGPVTLPGKIGAQVNRWWPNENNWYTAVITDFNADANEYRLTYNLGSANETYEDLDLDMADPGSFEILPEKIDLLNKRGSAAVNNSTVLQPFLARPAAGGGGGGSKSSKKRRPSTSSDSD